MRVSLPGRRGDEHARGDGRIKSLQRSGLPRARFGGGRRDHRGLPDCAVFRNDGRVTYVT